VNWLDYVIIGVIALSVIISVFRGFVREALSLLVWALAVWIGWTFFRDLAAHLTPWIDLPSLRLAAAMAILIVGVLIIGGLVTYLIGEIVERTGLSGTDRMLGMVFGAARGLLLVAVLVLLAGLTPLPQDPWWGDSLLVGYFEEMAIWLRDLLPSDVAERFRFGIDTVIQTTP
jgi:membrane protein required for colicin V production